MRYARLSERIQSPQCLQIVVEGQPYDIMLHPASRRRVDNIDEAGDFARGFRHPASFLWLFTSGQGRCRVNGCDHDFQPGTLVDVALPDGDWTAEAKPRQAARSGGSER